MTRCCSELVAALPTAACSEAATQVGSAPVKLDIHLAKWGSQLVCELASQTHCQLQLQSGSKKKYVSLFSISTYICMYESFTPTHHRVCTTLVCFTLPSTCISRCPSVCLPTLMALAPTPWLWMSHCFAHLWATLHLVLITSQHRIAAMLVGYTTHSYCAVTVAANKCKLAKTNYSKVC